MRVIDADALTERLERKKSGVANGRFTEGFNDALMRFRSMLHSEPTIDYVTVLPGYWKHKEPVKDDGQKPFVCSTCGLRHPRYGDVDKAYFSYCPWCGTPMNAEMDGGKEDG